MIFCVMKNISAKKASLPTMSQLRRKYYLVKFLRNLISLLICYNLGISPWVSNMWWVMGVLCYRVLSTGSVFWWWPPLCVQRALWSSSSCLSWTRENGDGEMKILVWSSLVLSLQVCISTVKAPYWWKEGTSLFVSLSHFSALINLIMTYLPEQFFQKLNIVKDKSFYSCN